MSRLARRLAPLLFPALLATPSCSKENNVDQSEKTTNNIRSGVVDGEGGLIGDRNDVGVFVPKFALDGQVEINLRTAEPSEYQLPAGAAGAVYSFEPRDAVFFTDVDIYIPRPDPSVTYQAMSSSDGITWSPVSSKVDNKASALHFTVIALSYFVAVATTEAAPPDVGPPGSGTGGAGSNPVPPPPVDDMCTIDSALPQGIATTNGFLTSDGTDQIPWASKDGFASIADMGGKSEVGLVLSDMPEACGAAYAAGTSAIDALHNPSGRAESSTLGISFMVDGTLVPGSYTPERVMLHAFDATCAPKSTPQPVSGTVEITSFTGDAVVGTFDLSDAASGLSITGDFNVPVCNLPEAPTGRCCPL